MANISNQFLINLSQAVGVSYNLKNNVLGSKTQPNSAIFNITQISSLLVYGKPIFGVYDDPNSFSSLTYNSALNVFQFSAGQVFYNRNLINLASQIISPINSTDVAGTKLFQFYIDYNNFIQASTVFSTTIKSVNGNQIVVNQLPSINYLNNFNTINLNNYIVGVSNININTNTITLTQNVTAFAFTGATVNLIFQPLIKYIYSFAVTGNPPVLPLPSSAIPFAQATVIISGTSTLTYSCPGGVSKTFTAFQNYTNPSSLFPNQAAYNAFLQSVNSSIQAYNNIQNYDLEQSIVASFSNYTQGIASNITSFDSYWHSQPFLPTTLFQYGINYAGLQKVDFDSRFKNFWYAFKNVELTRTFAIFRGDIYGGNAYIGQVLGLFPGTVSISNYIDFSGNSTNYNGTYSYGVSAIVPSGEYAPIFSSTGQFFFNSQVNNYISWTSPTINNLLFFHIYKNIQINNGFEQQRITNPGQVTGYTLADTILSSLNTVQGIGSSNFAFQIYSSSANSGIIGGICFNAYITNPTPLTGIQSYIVASGGQNYVAPVAVISGVGIGATFSLTVSNGSITGVTPISFGSGYTQLPTISIFDTVSSNATGAVIIPVLSQLKCGIYTGTSSSPLGTSIATLSPITIASISSAYTIDLPVVGANFIGLQSNTDYWAVFTMNTPYALNSTQQINFIQSSGFSGNYASSNNGTSWLLSTTNVQIAKLGFVDQNSSGTVTSSRGTFLTNDQASIPLRLQLYVPNIDLSSLSFGDLGPGVVVNGSIQTSLPVQNSMTVYVTAHNSQTGITEIVTGNINRGTARGTSVVLGLTTQVYDTVLDVYVQSNITSPTGMNYVSGTNIINWTIFDLFTVDSKP